MMKTFTAWGRIAALISSPLLLGLYVYDRSGGNLFAPWLAPAASAPTTPAPPNASAGSVGDKTFEQVSRHFRERMHALDVSAPPTTTVPKPLVITSKSAAVDLVTVPQAIAPAPAPMTTERTSSPMMFPGSKSIVMPSLVQPPPTPSPPVAHAPGSLQTVPAQQAVQR